MPKLDLAAIAPSTGCNYPAPFAEICLGADWRKLGDAAGLTDFGVNLVRLPPGKWSSQRHWHSEEDEFLWMLEGEVVLVEDDGEQVLRPGDACGWKAGVANGHHVQNRADRDAVYLEVGSRRPQTDGCDYPDIDMVSHPQGAHYRHHDGTPYPQD
ncbi:cupin domain-containing protein [Phenylobacterium sp.]|uniref:cupin domain-containing protein n=1 Tax=Phenylobacterium sp. TaxID=1871053 RepID=UPI002DEB2352|nr:cupin domain-containing protein [Phenylobacterium sp.]